MAEYIVYPNIPQEKALKAFLEALEIPFEEIPDAELPKYVLDGIAKGQADFEAGRFITFDQFKKRLKISK